MYWCPRKTVRMTSTSHGLGIHASLKLVSPNFWSFTLQLVIMTGLTRLSFAQHHFPGVLHTAPQPMLQDRQAFGSNPFHSGSSNQIHSSLIPSNQNSPSVIHSSNQIQSTSPNNPSIIFQQPFQQQSFQHFQQQQTQQQHHTSSGTSNNNNRQFLQSRDLVFPPITGHQAQTAPRFQPITSSSTAGNGNGARAPSAVSNSFFGSGSGIVQQPGPPLTFIDQRQTNPKSQPYFLPPFATPQQNQFVTSPSTSIDNSGAAKPQQQQQQPSPKTKPQPSLTLKVSNNNAPATTLTLRPTIVRPIPQSQLRSPTVSGAALEQQPKQIQISGSSQFNLAQPAPTQHGQFPPVIQPPFDGTGSGFAHQFLVQNAKSKVQGQGQSQGTIGFNMGQLPRRDEQLEPAVSNTRPRIVPQQTSTTATPRTDQQPSKDDYSDGSTEDDYTDGTGSGSGSVTGSGSSGPQDKPENTGFGSQTESTKHVKPTIVYRQTSFGGSQLASSNVLPRVMVSQGQGSNQVSNFFGAKSEIFDRPRSIWQTGSSWPSSSKQKLQMEPFTENFCDFKQYPDHYLHQLSLQRVDYFIGNTSCSSVFYKCGEGMTFRLNCSHFQVFDVATANCNFRQNVATCPDFDHILHCSESKIVYVDGTIREQCAQNQFACCAPPQQCIEFYRRCDGAADCSDGEDENNCQACEAWEYPCFKSGKCIPYEKRCNGIDDCLDGTQSDELNCGNCGPSKFFCHRSGGSSSGMDEICVDLEFRCNGLRECPNGEDELNCKTKGPKTLLCENQKLSVPKEQWCDGVEDCSDGSDEKYCFQR